MASDTGHRGGTGPGPGDPQDRPSLRLRMAAALLQSGDDPEQVAERTRVPLALIELLAEEITTTGSTNPVDSTADVDAAELDAAELDAAEAAQMAHLWRRRELTRRVRRRVLLFRIGLVVIAVNLLASVIADLDHHYLLGLVSVILAPVLVLAMIWSLTQPARRRPRRPPG